MAILYKANEMDFNHLGLGPLDDAVSILVTEERNGMFELEMSYPIEGTRINEIKLDRLIKADAGHNLKGQRFKIIRITKPIDGIVTVNAEHVSYLTQDLALKPTVNYSGTASQALNTWNNNLVDDSPFIVASDVTTTGNGSWSIKEVKNAREALGGVSGSILETYGGEYRFDNYSIRLMAQRGVNSGALIAYGRNLVDLTQEESIADTFTSVYPYAVYQDVNNKEVLLTLPEYFVDSEYVGNYARRKILPVDFSEDEIKDVTTLRSRTNSYIKSNGIGIPKVNMQIKYIDLAKTLDYKDLAVLEEVNLCDNIFVYFEQLDVNTSAKIIKTVWDDLLEQYDSIEVGEAKSSLSNSINATVDGKLETIVNQVNTIQLTADGLNVIYRGPEEPVPGNIGDLWYEPDGIYENMYQWDGSIWKLMLSTRDLDSVSEEVKKHTAEIATATKSASDAVAKADQAITAAGFSQVDSAKAIADALSALSVANAAKLDASGALIKANIAISDSGTAIVNAANALSRVGAVEETTGSLTTSYDALTSTVGLKADKTTVDGINQTVNQQGLNISANATAVGLKADKTVVDTINSTVASHTLSIEATADSLATKAEKTLVDSLNGTVASHTSQIKVNADGLALKADSNTVNSIKGTVDTHTTQIKATSDGLALKADSSTVNTLSGTVSIHSSQISAQSTAITAKLTSAQVESAIAAKNYVNSTTLAATSTSLSSQITQVEASKVGIVEAMNGKGKIFNNPVSDSRTSVSGALVINTPITSSYMVKLSISGYNYTGTNSNIDLEISFYATTTLANYSYVNKGNFPVDSVRIARDSSGRMVVIIGTGLSTWAYPKIQVTQAMIGHNTPPDSLKDGWSIEYLTVFPTYTLMTTVPGVDYNVKISTIEQTVEGVQTTVGTKASQSQVTQIASQVSTKVESVTYNSKMTQLDSLINLRVAKADLISQINIQSNNILIQSGKLYLDAASVVFSGSAFIPNAAITSLTVDKLNGGTANFANFTAINMNANSIATGTISGANSAWNLNTGNLLFTNPSTGDNLYLSQGQIRFEKDGQTRLLQYNAEGLQVKAGAGNTGTSNNTALHLVGGGGGSYQYIQFLSAESGGIAQRLEAYQYDMRLYHAAGGKVLIKAYSGDDHSGIIRAARFETSDATGYTLEMDGDQIRTPRDGQARNIFITPNGIGAVIAGASGGIRYNVNASDFVKQSSRTTKTNIVPLTEGLGLINRLTPVSYNKIDKLNQGIIELEKGFISEDSFGVTTPDGKGIYDSHINAHLVKAVQELDVRTASETDLLKEEIRQLKIRIQKLESAA